MLHAVSQYMRPTSIWLVQEAALIAQLCKRGNEVRVPLLASARAAHCPFGQLVEVQHSQWLELFRGTAPVKCKVL